LAWQAALVVRSTSPPGGTAAASTSQEMSFDPSAEASGPAGRIAFMRGDPSEGVLAGEGITLVAGS
jgi:hypothetical protein